MELILLLLFSSLRSTFGAILPPKPRYNLANCEEHRTCPCVVHNATNTVRPCHSLDAFAMHGTEFGGIEGKTDKILVLSGDYVETLPAAGFSGTEALGIVIRDAPLGRVENDAFFQARVNFIQITTSFAGGLLTLPRGTFFGWKDLGGAQCGDFKGFEVLDGTCNALSFVLDPKNNGRWNKGKKMEFTAGIFKELNFLQAFRLEGPIGLPPMEFSDLTNVKHLRIGGVILRDLMGSSLADMTKLESIQIVMDSEADPKNVARYIPEWLSGKPNLKKIVIERMLIDGEFGFFLSKLNNTKSVRELAIRSSTIAEMDERLVNLTNLEILDFADTAIDIAVMKNFTENRRKTRILPKLREVRLMQAAGLSWDCPKAVCASGPFKKATKDGNLVFTAEDPEPPDSSAAIAAGTLSAMVFALLVTL